jgi:chemotaxis protein MotA
LGGTLLALLVQYRPVPFLNLVRAALGGLFGRAPQPALMGERLQALAEIARRGGPLALEEEAAQESDPFLAAALRAMAEGGRPDELRSLLQIELDRLAASREEPVLLLEAGANLAPAFGMVGTLIALIGGRGIGPALLPTLYGTVLGPIGLQSLAGSLRNRVEQQLRLWSVMMEVMVGIAGGDAPRQVVERLQTLVPGTSVRRSEGAEGV